VKEAFHEAILQRQSQGFREDMRSLFSKAQEQGRGQRDEFPVGDCGHVSGAMHMRAMP